MDTGKKTRPFEDAQVLNIIRRNIDRRIPLPDRIFGSYFRHTRRARSHEGCGALPNSIDGKMVLSARCSSLEIISTGTSDVNMECLVGTPKLK